MTFIATSGCQIVGGYDEFEYDSPSAVEAHACAVLPTTKDDDRRLGVMARIDMVDGRCYWLDPTEVTVGQYAAWQEDVPAPVGWDMDFCEWKQERSDPIHNPDDACAAELLPLDFQPFEPRKPMRCVDFCEAAAFCTWAGKRLCHDATGLGGQGPLGYPQEWQLACTNQLTTRYPWGNDRQTHCNAGQSQEACVGASATCGPVKVGQESECSTPDGIVDLLGNVSEWVYSCNFVDPERPLDPTDCVTRGGGYDDPLRTCDTPTMVPSDQRKPSLGFRCCADLTEMEAHLVASTRR